MGAFSASASNDRTVRIWDVGRRECQAVFTGRYSVGSVAFSPDGMTLASADESGFITLWDPDTRIPREVINADDEEVRALAFSPDGHTLASAGISRTVRLWDPVTGQELLSLEGAVDRSTAWRWRRRAHAALGRSRGRRPALSRDASETRMRDRCRRTGVRKMGATIRSVIIQWKPAISREPRT